MNKRNAFRASGILAILSTSCCPAQWLTGIGGFQYLRPPTEGVRVGTLNLLPPSALTVNGEQMTHPTGEVFRTDAPGHADTYWRMFHEGKEFGNLFHLDQTKDFNINATQGYLRFRTNTINRMRLSPTLTGQTVNGYTGLNLSGFLGVGNFASSLVSRPHSMLHLDAGGTQDSGYRPWMQSGMTITRQSDQGYFGLKDEGGAKNHTVIAWSDNTLAHPGPDLLKFLFIADNTAANGTAGTLDGLEAVRVAPAGNGNESFFGIGDWFTTGGNANPTERLDVLDGRVRIRQLPDNPEAEQPYKVMVVDDSNDPLERGVVKWKDISGLGACGSGWSLNGNNAVTAYNGNPCIPQAPDRVGIGTANPFAKLYVRRVTNSGTPLDLGLYVGMSTTGANNVGGYAQVGSETVNVGWRGEVVNGTKKLGVGRQCCGEFTGQHNGMG